MRALIQSIIRDDFTGARKLIDSSPGLASSRLGMGATRQNAAEFYFGKIGHYLYAGDTPLHAAAAGYRVRIAKLLLMNGADVSARNRRGAQPLHYAADGRSEVIKRKAEEQSAMIYFLIKSGANPNSVDKNGSASLHRAVRTRCFEAVNALVACGADFQMKNRRGSTPLHLAVQNTGRGGTGSEMKASQKEIIELLLDMGADPSSRDGRGKTVLQCAKSKWIHALL